MKIENTLTELWNRAVNALERMAPPAAMIPDFQSAEAFIWQSDPESFIPVERINRLPVKLLQGIDQQITLLIENTVRFANGYPANNALLWGARGMGKSSLVKAVHAHAQETIDETWDADSGEPKVDIRLIEIHREDIGTLPECLAHLRKQSMRFIVFCDDLSFDHDDTSYKSLKAVLEGGIEGRPLNVIFYATSNRRHLLPRDMMENERSTAINPSEAVEEKVSLSDRFGLWIGFHNCTQDDYLAMVRAYVEHFGLRIDDEKLKAESLEWSVTRGGRSGRVAWQYIQDLAGRLGQHLPV